MTETTRNFWVGAFVVVSVVVLATLMSWFGETPDWLGGNEWNLRITDVQGLSGIEAGSPVRLNGVEIGRVRSVDFVDAGRPELGVVILARIQDRYSIPDEAKALVFGATLGFGTGHVDIMVKLDQTLRALEKKNAQIHGEMRSMIGELITKDMVDSVKRTIDNIGTFAGAVTPVAGNLALLLEKRTVADVSATDSKLTANVATVVERLDAFVANLNTVLGDVNVQEDVKGVVRDLKGVADNLRETVELWKSETGRLTTNLNAGIDRTEENLERTFVNLNEVLDHLDEGAKSLALALREVAEGRGTAGLLVRDERLYEAAVLSLERVAEAMATFNRVIGKVESDGYFTVGAAPLGWPRKDYPIPAETREKN